MTERSRHLFVTGKLAEPSLRRVLDDLAPHLPFDVEVRVLPITVAALLTTNWVARHLDVDPNIEAIVLPGYCRGDLDEIRNRFAVRVERGPVDLRDLPEYYGRRSGPPPGYGQYDIEILAEINHAPRLSLSQLLTVAARHQKDGANYIDLGCDPASTWEGVGEAVHALKRSGMRVSIDSFNSHEVSMALDAGAELILSVNQTNIHHVSSWHRHHNHVEVVAIPDTPSDLASLDQTIRQLNEWGVKYRVDPIVEPIGFGFAASLGRYLNVRQRYPDTPMMMGVGNLTELTDVDSAGVNVLLAGFCQEQRITSVLTTEVINWCRSSVREFDLARRLVYHAVHQGVLPKKLEPRLVMLRDTKLHELGEAGMAELASRITDRNYRLFAERGELHVINGSMYVHGKDPFELFAQMQQRDPKLDASHAFYLGYELSKALTALTLGKDYRQDQSLNWGFLTIPEVSHRNPGSAAEESAPASVEART